jgi:hypothetical protein
LLDVNATVRSLTVQASSDLSDFAASGQCSAPSVFVATRLRVTGRCAGSDIALFVFEPLSSIECDTVSLDTGSFVTGNGSFIAASTIEISGSLWLGSGPTGCCSVVLWPGLDSGLPQSNELVFSAPDIVLNGATIALSGQGQFARFQGRLNSVSCTVQIPRGVASSSPGSVSWTSIAANSSFTAQSGTPGPFRNCPCSGTGQDGGGGPVPGCAAPGGGGLTIIVVGPSGCPCSGCATGTHCTASGVCACDNGRDSPLCVIGGTTSGGGTSSSATTNGVGSSTGGALQSGSPSDSATQSSSPATALSGGAIAGT